MARKARSLWDGFFSVISALLNMHIGFAFLFVKGPGGRGGPPPGYGGPPPGYGENPLNAMHHVMRVLSKFPLTYS